EQADDHRDAEHRDQGGAADSEGVFDVLFRQVCEHRGDRDETHQDQLANAQLAQEIQLFLLLRHPLLPAGVPACCLLFPQRNSRRSALPSQGIKCPGCRKRLSRKTVRKTKPSLQSVIRRRRCRILEKITLLRRATPGWKRSCASWSRSSARKWSRPWPGPLRSAIARRTPTTSTAS